LADGGIIIFDNINFHGLVGYSHDKTVIRTRRLRAMIKRIEEFIEFIMNHPDYEAIKYESGDGFIICKKRG
jgi:predicted O-methyltransferase YrrM